MQKRLCVFAGSAAGKDPRYVQEAWKIGEICAQQGWAVVYGGGGAGLMGAVADGALSAGGSVEGVIPDYMIEREWGHKSLDLHIVKTMHERKQRMHDRCHAFLALPGGIGTFDELCEALAWQKLAIHAKPVALLNTAGFFHPFLEMLRRTVEQGFYHPSDFARLLVLDKPDDVIKKLLS